MKIRTRIILTFSIMSLIAVSAVSTLVLYYSIDGMKKAIKERERANAALISERIDSAFNDLNIKMQLIGDTVRDLNYIDYDALTDYLATLSHEYHGLDTGIALANGQFMNSQGWSAPKNFAFERPWYIGAKNTSGLFIGEPYASVSDLGMYIAMPLSRQFKLHDGSTAVIMNDIYLSVLVDILEKSNAGQNTYISLIDQNYQILYHPSEKYNIKLNTEKQSINFVNLKNIPGGENIIKAMQADNDKFLELAGYDGIDRLFFLEKSKLSGYTVCIAVPASAVYASLNSAMTISITFIVVILVLTLIVAFIIGSKISRPIKDITYALKDISEGSGDLRVVLNSKYNDETGEMSNYFNETIGKIRSSVSHISSNSNALKESSRRFTEDIYRAINSLKEIVKTTESVNRQSISQASSVEESVATTEEILHTINNFNTIIEKQTNSVSNATSSVEEMVANVETVTQVLEKNMAQINDLEAQSSNAEGAAVRTSHLMTEIDKNSKVLLKASNVIKKIAERTNLLAMNAAIEASHSGEAGKGFAVVANEIRSLANESSAQSKSITAVLATLKEQVVQCVSETQNSEKNFKEIFALSKRIRNHEEYVIQAMVEQRVGNTEVLKSIDEVNGISQQTHNGFREILEAVTQISSEMQNLMNITETLKKAMENLAGLSETINGSLTTLGDINAENNRGINELDYELSKFKV